MTTAHEIEVKTGCSYPLTNTTKPKMIVVLVQFSDCSNQFCNVELIVVNDTVPLADPDGVDSTATMLNSMRTKRMLNKHLRVTI